MHFRFGPAGNSNSFYEEGYKSSLDMPKWLKSMDLSAYEYQCSRGVNIGEVSARKLGEAAALNGISLSIHAPYYINMATTDPVLREKSRKHLISSIKAAGWMGAGLVVFHPGSAKEGRIESMKTAKQLLGEIVVQASEEGLDHIFLAPETMGKRSLLGSLDEVLDFCSVGANIIPAVDFAHLHAVSDGGFGCKAAFAEVFEKITSVLGKDELKRLHIHFSPVEYTSAGEKKHRSLRDGCYGPNFMFLAEQLVEASAEFTVICESDGVQAEDALIFKSIYEAVLKEHQDKKD